MSIYEFIKMQLYLHLLELNGAVNCQVHLRLCTLNVLYKW